ncbi:unnamed protein product [Cuscuta campestris]|uniref:Major facilitator superfamily (MFS) profile domain-containing protein n=1 Tax=Cuscuta campestris TaxID=132261 RepID=A0A484LW64_9ASTE|nr:unnamed protein product [Cuscuta campestris]
MLSRIRIPLNSSHNYFAFLQNYHCNHHSLPPNLVQDYANLLNSCILGKAIQPGRQLHARFCIAGLGYNTLLATKLVNLYCVCDHVSVAHKLFAKIPKGNLFLWNVLIRGYAWNGPYEVAISLYFQLLKHGHVPDNFTFPFVLKACSALSAIDVGRDIHEQVVEAGWERDVFVCAALIDMYAKGGRVDSSRKVFDGVAQRDVVVWNSMLAAYSKNGCADECLLLCSEMAYAGVGPTDATLVTSISASADIAALQQGRELHGYSFRQGFGSHDKVMTALVDMYAKSGHVKLARMLFEALSEKRVVSWNAMITGYAMHGHANAALDMFEWMIRGAQPDHITFVGVLSACNHGGMVDEAKMYFEQMTRNYSIEPTVQHYTCMVDLLGHFGRLDEAYGLITQMKVAPDSGVWGALLNSCKIHGDVELAELALEKLVELEPNDAGNYVILSNIYAQAELEILGARMVQAGYTPNTLPVFHDVDDDEKTRMVSSHSERLAIVFGLIMGISMPNELGYYNGKLTSFVVLSCVMAAMGGVIFGYDIGISGGVTSMEPFLEKFFHDVYTKMKKDTEVSNYCKFDSQLLTSFTSSLYVAGLFASLLASSVTATFGRTPSILMGGFSFLAGAALGGAALNIYMLILGRVFLGIGVGFANQAVPLYLSEMAPAKYRGGINNGFQVSVSIGVLVASLINYGTEKIRDGWGWRISLGLASVPAFILTLSGLFLPETPNSLIQRFQDHGKAKRMLERIRGTNDVQAELDDLISASEISKTVKTPFKNILLRKYRPQLIMSIAIPFFQQVTGINVIGFYAPVIFRTIGLGESASLMSSVVTGSVGIITTFASMMIVDKVGRRPLLITGGVVMFVTQMAVGAVLGAKLGNHGGVSKDWAVVVLLLLCGYVAGFGLSWGPLGWLIPSEIFQLEIRSAGQSITVCVSFLFTFLVGQSLLAMLCHFRYGIFFFFGGWVAVMTAFVYLLLPETKKMPIEKMDRVWREHWFWKKFVEESK